MKNLHKIKRIFLLAFLLPVLSANAQYKVKQMLIANGGIFFGPGNKITIGSYNPVTKNYTLFDSVTGNSVTQIVISGTTAFMATDSFLVSYDLDNLKRINIAKVNGLRHIALYKDMIAAAIGNDGTNTHFKLLKQSDLSVVFSENKIPAFSEGITIAGDSAFIALQGDYPNYNDTGKIAVEDLVNHKLQRIITLDTAARGIGALFSNGSYVIGITEYPYARLSKVNINTGAVSILSSSIFSPFELNGDSLYGDINGSIGKYDLSTKNVTQYLKPKTGYYAAAELDTINKLFYYTGAVYTKPTHAYIAEYSGMILDSFPIGISPEGIAIDYRKKSGIEESTVNYADIQLFPNPAKTTVSLYGYTGNNADITIQDMEGRIQISKRSNGSNGNVISIPVDQLPSGFYIINIKTEAGIITKKFVKN
jgi:hypothetical protein